MGKREYHEGSSGILAEPEAHTVIYDSVWEMSPRQEIPKYDFSEVFSLYKRKNELYQVLSILKKLGQLVNQ
ncbi:MAG: hypothetical protein F6K58_10375 [Symploca sp. SIO2E9]|nr:hypothetical protein [Symploca sp. SIO2E9]